MNQLCLIVFNHKTKEEDFVLHDDLAKIYSLYQDMSESFESKGIMLINEEILGKNTRLRDFASEADGLLYSLIVCGGIVNNITLTHDNIS